MHFLANVCNCTQDSRLSFSRNAFFGWHWNENVFHFHWNLPGAANGELYLVQCQQLDWPNVFPPGNRCSPGVKPNEVRQTGSVALNDTCRLKTGCRLKPARKSAYRIYMALSRMNKHNYRIWKKLNGRRTENTPCTATKIPITRVEFRRSCEISPRNI